MSLTLTELSLIKMLSKLQLTVQLELTKTEYDLLYVLAENRNHVMQREQILDHVWGFNSEVETNVVDVYIRYLRNKLKPLIRKNRLKPFVV